MDLLMDSFWTGHATYQRAAGMRPSPQIDFNLPPHLVQELTDSFTFFDRNGDGQISKAELGAVLRSLGQSVTEADLEKLMNDVDVNGDGYIDLYEFIDLNTRAMNECPMMDTETESLDQSVSTEGLLSAFNVFDADRNGFISAEELHRVLVALGDEKISLEDCRRMIKCVDEDGDQMVDFREFETMMSGTCVF